MGVVLPVPGFLDGLRTVCTDIGALLVFDEVMTGFRVAPGGVQQRYEVTPDLTTLGKIIGGGLPVGAYGGRADIMSTVAPEGDVYQAGTLSGNPLAMTAGIVTLRRLRDGDAYDLLAARARALADGIAGAIDRHRDHLSYARVGSMSTLFFNPEKVCDFDGAMACDTDRFAAYHRGMLERGVYLPPSQFEANFISLAHTEADIARTAKAIGDTLDAVLGDR
jgi:glutamate-1-semialdehyde 2,1-aminomutase